MSNLNETLIAYAKDTENAELNFQMALHYEALNQTASAISYFLRCAERTDNDKLAYECLCKIGLCFERQGRRGNSARGYYQLAMALLPRRPEAYYLLARYYERITDYPNAYMYGQLGELFTDHDPAPLRTWVEYPGRWGLTFEKGVAAWWIGKSQESRDIWQYLKNEHYTHMDQGHIDAVQRNMCNLGCGPQSQAFHRYDRTQHHLLRYAFPGSETIDENWSQVYQDLFILACLNGKKDGRYLEIGSAGPWLGNNTALLEKKFGWKGIGVEWDENLCKEYRAVRTNTVLQADALKLDYADICSQLSDAYGIIDYLQLDIEPAHITYECMLKIPFDRWRFRVITYEHDHYVDITGTMREKSRDFLRSKGYRLLVNDMSPDGKSTFEDWWVHPDLVDPKLMEMMDAFDGKIKYAPNYMVGGPVPLRLNSPDEFDWGKIKENFTFLIGVDDEIFKRDIYQKYFSVEKDDVVMDIGASVGPFSYSIMNKEPKITFCLEPHPELFQTLQKNMRGKPAVLLNCAIANTDSDITTNSLFDETTMNISDRQTKVQAMTFKTLVDCYGIDTVDFMKIDCEGGEYDLFTEENFDWIVKNVKKIAGEFHLHTPEMKEKFRKFRDLYLKHFTNFKVESVDGVDISWWLWTDEFIQHYFYFNIYVDNR